MTDDAQRAVEFLKLAAAGEVDAAYRLTAEGGRHHNPYFAAGWEALKAGMRDAAEQAPDRRLDVKHVITSGELVAVHSHVVPRPGDDGMAVVHLFRFEAGKIAELWDVGQALPPDSPNADGPF
ncbi:polyketide cyclase [Streptomyces griseocarneus]|nr:polyketide cyclase [Streptomyces griseocarneus]